MNWMEPAASLVGAIIGASAAIAATWWQMKRAARESRAASRAAERSSLQALLLEIDVVKEIAREESATSLPTEMLTASLPGVHQMDASAKGSVVTYSAAIQRYNGRAQRAIAFRAAKVAAGQNPEETKVGRDHAERVCKAAKQATTAIEEQLKSSRLPG